MALTDSLISYWKLDEKSGTRVDEVGGNTLTDNNTVTGNPGKLGKAAQFTSANNEYLSHVDNAALSTGDIDFTVACWVYVDTLVNGAARAFMAKYDTGVSKREYLLYLDQHDAGSNPDKVKFLVSPDGGVGITQVVATSFGALSAATWYFIVAWHDSVANTINVCINDGTVDSAAHSTGVFDSTAPFELGGIFVAGAPYGPDAMDGRIDGAGFWKKVLSGAEITSLYASGAGLDYPFTCPYGPYTPSTLTNVAVGDVAWTNPGNADFSDNVYATSITVAQTTQQLQATALGFSIPSTQQIDGILVECEAKSTLGGDTVLCRIIKGGSVSSTSKSNTFENVEAQVSYGGSTDLWGETWTPADINSATFGVSVRQESVLTGTLSVDAVRITVYCSTPGSVLPRRNNPVISHAVRRAATR